MGKARSYKQDQKNFLLDLFKRAVRVALPSEAMSASVKRKGKLLLVGDREYSLKDYRKIFVVGAGKAGGSMAAAVEEILGGEIAEGIVIVKDGHLVKTRKITLLQSSHPIPDERAVLGTRRILQLLNQAENDDMVIILISGGGSALLELPVEGVSLDDLRKTTDLLLKSGAAITEINTVRKHLSQVKGGRLAAWAFPSEAITLIISDVIGSPLDVIASGPTVPDPSNYKEAWEVLERYRLLPSIPRSVADHLKRGADGFLEETLKPKDPAFRRMFNLVVADGAMAAHAALQRAKEIGYSATLMTTSLEGEAREVGKVIAGVAREIRKSGNPVHPGGPVPRHPSLPEYDYDRWMTVTAKSGSVRSLPDFPCVVLWSGEPTVTIRGKGKGGRAQELALSFAIAARGIPDVMLLACGTDGTDGPTDAAGAIADGTTFDRAVEAGLKPSSYLDNNNSYEFFQELGDLVITGPTGTNVNDLFILSCF